MEGADDWGLLITARDEGDGIPDVRQAMQDGVAVFDMRGRMVFLNQAQVKIGAYPTGEQVPQSPSEFAKVLELRWGTGRRGACTAAVAGKSARAGPRASTKEQWIIGLAN